jgi:hypothetical protein
MKTRRHVRLFQPRFASLVESGAKTTTIRPTPKRPIRVGDVLDLRTWTGQPYRSKQRKLREAVCTAVRSIEMDCIGGLTWLSHVSNYVEAAEKVARREGFADRRDMIRWFKETHGFPFKGVLIEWQP